MSNYTFFTVEQYGKVCVLTWTESAATRVLHNGELRIELANLPHSSIQP